MSLLHALDPGASPSRPGCEARGCRSTFTTSVRAYLGRIHPTTIRVCETHRRGLEVIGDLENPVSCLIPECGRTRATPSRLCADHDRIVVAAGIRIPKTGVIGAETLVKVRKAVEADQDKRAAAHFETLVAAASPAQSATAVQLKADDACMAEFSSSIGGMQFAADLVMAALTGRLAEMPAGVELSLQLALTGVVGLLASERGAVAQRDALAATVAATTATLNELRAPDGAQQPDGTIDTSEATRIRLLLAYWSDAIRSVLPGNAERATGERAEPLVSLLQDIRAGLEAAQKAAQPTPSVQADPPAGWPPSWDDLTPNLNVWRRLQAGHSFYLPATEEGRLAAWVLTGWRPGADGAALAEAERVAGLNPGITWVAEALEGIAGPGVYPHRDYMPTRMLRLLEEVSDDRARMAVVRRERDQLKADLAALQACPTVQPDPLRVQATPAEGFSIAIEWTLDTVEAPRAPTLSDRITALAAQRDELRDHLDAIRKALNVGPPSDSDVQPGTSPERLTEIVRARTVRMLEERDQRVALAEEVEALKKTLGDPLAPAVKALVAWLDLPTGAALLEQMIRAVAKHTVPPEAAIRALHSEEEMARLILSTPKPFGVPF